MHTCMLMCTCLCVQVFVHLCVLGGGSEVDAECLPVSPSTKFGFETSFHTEPEDTLQLD